MKGRRSGWRVLSWGHASRFHSSVVYWFCWGKTNKRTNCNIKNISLFEARGLKERWTRQGAICSPLCEHRGKQAPSTCSPGPSATGTALLRPLASPPGPGLAPGHTFLGYSSPASSRASPLQGSCQNMHRIPLGFVAWRHGVWWPSTGVVGSVPSPSSWAETGHPCRTRLHPVAWRPCAHSRAGQNFFLQQVRCAINVTVLYLSKIKLNLTLIP